MSQNQPERLVRWTVYEVLSERFGYPVGTIIRSVEGLEPIDGDTVIADFGWGRELLKVIGAEIGIDAEYKQHRLPDSVQVVIEVIEPASTGEMNHG